MERGYINGYGKLDASHFQTRLSLFFQLSLKRERNSSRSMVMTICYIQDLIRNWDFVELQVTRSDIGDGGEWRDGGGGGDATALVLGLWDADADKHITHGPVDACLHPPCHPHLLPAVGQHVLQSVRWSGCTWGRLLLVGLRHGRSRVDRRGNKACCCQSLCENWMGKRLMISHGWCRDSGLKWELKPI